MNIIRFNFFKKITCIVSFMVVLGCKCNFESNEIVPMKPYLMDSELNINTTSNPNLFGRWNRFKYYGIINYCENDSFLVNKLEKIIFGEDRGDLKTHYSVCYYFFETENGKAPIKNFHFNSINKLVSSESLRAAATFRDGKLLYFKLANNGEYYFDVLNDRKIREIVE